MLTVAIVGFGLSGRYLQGPFMVSNPTLFRVKTVLSITKNPQNMYPNVQVARTLDEILADVDIDLVSIASPNETHFDYARRCLLAGKHVLVEKPFTATVSEAKELIALAQKQKKVLTVFQNRRFDSDFLTVKKVVENKLLGELLTFEIHFDRYKPILNPKKWKEITGPSSGILYDLGAHIIDQALVLFGKPVAVSGETFRQRQGSEIDDAFEVRLDYGQLKVTLKASLLVREEGPRYVIHGSKGSFVKYGIDVQEDHLKMGMWPKDKEFGIEPADKWGILNTEINGQHFKGRIETEVGNWSILFENIYEAITNGRELLVKPEQIIEQLAIIEAVKKT
jgi:scyllo-inositol 2-dehydrogenase (NADP+)